ncbi:unnamed protein product, partial [Polarella glacialis]
QVSTSALCTSTTSTPTLTYSALMVTTNGGDGRGHGQSFGGGLPLGDFNKQIPPGWRPGIPNYPIKLYFERLKLWHCVTENAEAQLGVLIASRLQGVPQKIALRLRLPRPAAAGGGYDIGDEALIRLSQAQLTDPATGTIVQEYIPSTSLSLITGNAYLFLRGSGLGDKVVDDIKLQMLGDMSKYNEIRSKDKESLNMYQDSSDFIYKLRLDEASGIYYGSWHDPTSGDLIEYDYQAAPFYQVSASDDVCYGDYDYDYGYDGDYADYEGSSCDLDDYCYGEDGWQDEMYYGDDDWQWQPQPSSSSTTAATEDNAIETDENYWGKFGGKSKGKGKGKSFGAKGKGPSGGCIRHWLHHLR